MDIQFLYPRWGAEAIPWHSFLHSVKEEGFAGIEWNPDGTGADNNAVVRLLQEMQLDYAIVTTVAAPYTGFDDYLLQLRRHLVQLTDKEVFAFKPLFISLQTGREFFTEEQVVICDELTCEIRERTGISIYHETHRNKWTYAVHLLPPVIKRRRNIAFTLDVSHWFCVSESYLSDQQEAVLMAIEHAHHIHARVGYDQGPQVADPALPEYAEALNEHLRIWDQWIEMRRKKGYRTSTITPEFGPPPYMAVAGRDLIPRNEQWRLNVWMKNLLLQRYGAETEQAGPVVTEKG
ncbi:xylose isomerase [Niabella drilacis]|uniref:Sugar phosphate isomerase/epimerase n=1 Tax=Niabella drilacis (strain DSM 25811 / CCM 8410 / CCUG 62505 / LMG 26954 / E90) TaxID=1285928 RepID=A0A1G6NKK5_NIADE|nr:xylose isomerase [Niabella drilacis]SDC68423.1 hypothetical protein SAMN04487894_103311 [Niabella drilacis]